MKIQNDSLKQSGKKRKKKNLGRSARSFVLFTACTCSAVVLAAGIRTADYNGRNKVYAASGTEDEILSSQSGEVNALPTGIAGVVSGINSTASQKKSVQRIGTSCELVMVVQRIKVIEDSVAEFDVSSSM